MKIRRFYAKDMSQALKQISHELGKDAAILSTKKSASGIEVIAAVDYDETILHKNDCLSESADKLNIDGRQRVQLNTNSSKFSPSMDSRLQDREDRVSLSVNNKQQQKSRISYREEEREQKQSVATSINGQKIADEIQQRLEQQQNKVQGDAAEHQAAELAALFESKIDTREKVQWCEDPNLTKLKDEVALLRNMLSNQMEGLAWQNQSLRSPVQSAIMEKLLQLGFIPSIAKKMGANIAPTTAVSEAWNATLSLIEESIQTTNYEVIKEGGVFAIVGPTGVGKTTTVAKLAARFALQHGPNSVALVTTDNYRIAAHEQLKIYGRIIGCSVNVVNNSDELESTLCELQGKRLILVDTAGMSQRDQRLVEQIERFNQVSSDIKKLLVLSATSNRYTLEETIKVFKRYQLAGCIISKTDEAVSLGEVLSLIMSHRLPLAYITNGQRVPEDIDLASSSQIVAQALQMSQSYKGENDEWWTAKQLGGASV